MERIDVSKLIKRLNEPRGFSDKYWIHYKDDDMLIKYNGYACPDQDVMECISSDILNLLDINTVNVALGFNTNMELDIEKKCCIVKSFLSCPGDVTINLLNNKWTRVKTDNIQKNISSCFLKIFTMFSRLMDISDDDFNNMKKDYIRTVFGDCIIDNEDRRLKNIEAIFNESDFSYRLAPSFDNGLAFNAFNGINTNDFDGYCYIGNQEFPASEIIKYIIEHYYEYISDIIYKLDNFINNDLDLITSKYVGEIDSKKLVYINDYINYTNNFIKSIIKKGYER